MKSEKNLTCLLLSLFFLISACSDENERGDYSGVSDLIADRNRARHEVAEKPSQKKIVIQKKTTGTSQKNIPKPTPSPNSKKEEISSIVLYKQEIEIIGAQSRRTMATGTAYVNKKGQIVRIKIHRE